MADPIPERTLVLGDVHGAARALDQVLDRANFDPELDRLVCLGDVCDRWPEVDRVLDRLLELDHLDLVLGNHDGWALEWMQSGTPAPGWRQVGGWATLRSYARRVGHHGVLDSAAIEDLAREVPDSHRRFLEEASPYLVEARPDGIEVLFTHAGWEPGVPPENQDEYQLRWARNLWVEARIREAAESGTTSLTGFDAVFLGHTPTDWTTPRPVLELWNLDQGAGWDGPLTLMDVDTHEWWQSDPVPELYPGE